MPWRNNEYEDVGALLSLPHVSVLKYYLCTIGGWPCIEKERDGINPWYPYVYVHCRAMQVLMCTILFGMFYYIYMHFAELNFFSLSDAYLGICIASLTVGKIFLVTGDLYYKFIKDCFVNCNLYQYKNEGTYQNYIYGRVHRVSRGFTYYIALIACFGCCLFNVPAIYRNLQEGSYFYHRSPNATLYFAVSFEYPGFKMVDHFYIATLITFIGCNAATVAICVLDCVMFLAMFQLIGHILILQHKIKNLGHHDEDPCSETTGMYSPNKNIEIHGKIKNAIIHHQLICRFAKDISSIFKVGNTCTYIYFLSGSCVLLFICSSLDPEVLSQFLPVTFITFGNLIQTSIIYELVTAVSDRLPATVYNTPWELMDNGNRRTLLIFLQRLQTPVRIEAFGSLKIGLESMTVVLKTTFSYYLFLQTVTYN